MGVSTDGQLTFGYSFDEDFEFPWQVCDEDDCDNCEHEIEEWWMKEKGFKPTLYPYSEEGGGRKEGVSDEEVDRYYKERREFNEANPCPVKLVIHCSYDYPLYILAVPELSYTADRGYPKEITNEMLSTGEEQKRTLKLFCKKYKIDCEGEPKWWLSSLWG